MKIQILPRLRFLLLAVLMLFPLPACDGQTRNDGRTNAGQRSYRVETRGGGKDVVTLMVYLCGSDLESENGAASMDILEMAAANISENLNIVVETGGANGWQNDLMNPNTNERWLITYDDITFLDDAGRKNMSEGKTLSDFITFASKKFPADRYMLVLWDHGGGTVDGFAYDERFKSGMMSIPELNQALATAGVVFDMIGFDCCLMSTAETAFMVEKYADYMVASQRVEPGNGWYYTPWIEALSQNTSIPTLELGRVIADSYIDECSNGYYGHELTLSVTDLTYITELFEELTAFFSAAREGLVADKTFISTSHVLGSSRAISDNYDLVDLAYLVRTMEGSDKLLSWLDRCVAYNRTTINDHNGLCLYFPYTDLSKVGDALDVYNKIGINETYREFITAFANLMLGGQVYSGGGNSNPLSNEDLFDPNYWTDFDWVDQQQFDEYEDFYAENNYDDSELYIEEKGDDFVLSLTDESWELIIDIQQRVFLDDGEGYIDLGADSIYEFDEDGDLLITFDNSWVALDGQLVCFYTKEYVEDGDYWFNWGIVPILYEGEYAELILRWDDRNPWGYVAGWRYSGSQKGLFELRDGMTFNFLCDYFDYDGYYEDQYLWGELTVDGTVEVSYEDVGDGDCEVYYELYDIYGNTYWTESVIYGY